MWIEVILEHNDNGRIAPLFGWLEIKSSLKYLPPLRILLRVTW